MHTYLSIIKIVEKLILTRYLRNRTKWSLIFCVKLGKPKNQSQSMRRPDCLWNWFRKITVMLERADDTFMLCNVVFLEISGASGYSWCSGFLSDERKWHANCPDYFLGISRIISNCLTIILLQLIHVFVSRLSLLAPPSSLSSLTLITFIFCSGFLRRVYIRFPTEPTHSICLHLSLKHKLCDRWTHSRTFGYPSPGISTYRTSFSATDQLDIVTAAANSIPPLAPP